MGIDIGTTTIRVVVAEFKKGEEYPDILAVSENETEGLRNGYIINQQDVLKSLRKCIKEVEKNSEIKIKKAFVSIGSSTIKGEISNGFAIVSKADNEVTHLDIEKAIEDAQGNLNLNNKKVINVSPIYYKLDGQDILGRIEGSIGNKLEVKAIFTTVSSQHFEDLINTIGELDIEVLDIIPGIIASSNFCLPKKQKIIGSILVDIGSETTKIAVFENENPIAIHTFNLGGADITNDIALGLKISIDEAEKIKLGNIPEEFSKKKIDEIINARLSDIFELIDTYLKKIKRNELLPGGIVLIGGTSNIPNILDLSKNFLKLPASFGQTQMFGNAKTKLKNNSWYNVLGLLFSSKEKSLEENGITLFFRDLKNTIKSNLKQFMP